MIKEKTKEVTKKFQISSKITIEGTLNLKFTSYPLYQVMDKNEISPLNDHLQKFNGRKVRIIIEEIES